MVRAEVYLEGGGVIEVEVDDFNLVQLGPMHKPSAPDFVASEEAKQHVPYLDFEEVAAGFSRPRTSSPREAARMPRL